MALLSIVELLVVVLIRDPALKTMRSFQNNTKQSLMAILRSWALLPIVELLCAAKNLRNNLLVIGAPVEILVL